MASGDIAPFDFAGTALTASLTTLYTVPTGQRMISLQLNVHVITQSASVVSTRIHFTTSGGTPGTTDRVIDPAGGNEVPVGSTRVYNLKPMLQAGATIRAVASSADVAIVRGAGMLRED